MTQQDQSSNSGEFAAGGNTIRTARQLTEYLNARRQNSPQSSRRPPKGVFHVIRPKYCVLLGINPDDMIAVSLAEIWAKKFEAEIETCFLGMDPEIPLATRIYESHFKAYAGGMDAIMSFVKQKFFPGAE